MTMLGMNPTSVEALGVTLDEHATAISTAAQVSGTALSELEWLGEDAETFRENFGLIIEAGQRAAEQIRGLGVRVNGEASQQRTTSLS